MGVFAHPNLVLVVQAVIVVSTLVTLWLGAREVFGKKKPPPDDEG